jgi:glycosyltransferase 2 family protein
MLSDSSKAAMPMEATSRPEQPQRKGVALSTILKAGITLLIFGYVLYTVDLSAAWKRAAGQDLPLVVVAGLILVTQVGLGGTRWLIILRSLGARPPAWETLKLFYVSIFFNSWVPGGIGGDVMRAWLSYRSNISAKTAITSVILDRVAALVAVATLVLLTAPSFLDRVGVSVTMLVPIVVSMVGLVGIVIAAQFDRLPERWLRFRPLRLLHELGSSVRLVFLRPATLFPLVGVAILGQTALGAATYAMAVSLSMNVSFLECVVLMQPVALVANLPITVGGWGVRESAMIMLFGLVGVPASGSLVLSIQLGLLLLIVALPGGLLWLLMKPKASQPAVASRS